MRSVGFSLPIIGLLLSIATLSLHAAETSQKQVYTKITPEEMAALLQEEGYRAGLKTSSSGKKYISSSAEGLKFAVFFYDCGETGCATMQYRMALNLPDGTTTDVVSQWNYKKLYGRAYLDKENDPRLDMVQRLRGGVTKDAMLSTLSIWGRQLTTFAKHVGFRR